MNYYMDASSVVKLYIEEAGSERIREINEGLTFISADVELNNAAKTEGLAVEYL